MSGPIRQQLSNVAPVTPTLNDKAVTIQANTVKTSSYTAIYNLFKAGFDSVYATIVDVASILTNANAYTDIQVATKQDLFDYSGSASGAVFVIIDDVMGGVAEFTQVILSRKTQYLRIQSNVITSTSKIICTLVYDGAGFPLIANQKVSTGRIDILVTNGDLQANGGATTDASIFIQYQIVG